MAEDSPRPALALARVNQPALAAWLGEAIGLVLTGHAPPQPHPQVSCSNKAASPRRERGSGRMTGMTAASGWP